MNSEVLTHLTQEIFGQFLSNDKINEICYNGTDKIYIENQNGKWEAFDVPATFDFRAAQSFATTAASFKNDNINELKPILSCVLPNGERVQIVMPPATKAGRISITIRKPSKRRFRIEDHERSGLFSEICKSDEKVENPLTAELMTLYKENQYKDFISKAVNYGKNVIICGGTGSGKTTFMKTLIDFIPVDERLITIEDVEEIVFYEHQNFVQLFYPSEAKSSDFLNSATLLKSCLRMKPDRILLAELRGAETYDFLNVLSSGHGGSITSLHAGSTDEAFARLAMMSLQNPQAQCIPYKDLVETIRGVIDVVVHISAHHGKRRIDEIYFKG